MSNYRRALLPGAAYFFTVVTHERSPIFTSGAHVEMLRTAFRKAMTLRPFQIDAMVVLPDHLHCIWQLPEGDTDFSSRWREIKKSASRQIDSSTNARRERSVWQRRFWEHAIRDEEDWRRHVDYIHYNPVKHCLVNRPADWAWSSFNKAVQKGWYDVDWGRTEPETTLKMDCE